jgi:PAS domain S-box-containing protein
VLDPTDDRLAAALEQRAATGRFFGELTFVRPDGSKFPAEVTSAVFEDDGGELRTCTVIRDITERKRMELELRAAAENLAAVVNASPLAIEGAAPDGTVTLWNHAAERLFGWSASDVVGRRSSLIPPNGEAEHAALRERVLRGESVIGIELQRMTKDGAPIDVSLSTACIRDRAGQIVGVLGVFEDTRDRKAAEHARTREQRLAALRELSLGLRHEVNNALAALRGEMDLLAILGPLSSEQSEGLATVLRLLNRIAASMRRLEHVEDLNAVPYLGNTTMLDVSAPDAGKRSDRS